ncbi:MAG TPA: MATE family efflux transporter [Ignavibacteriaceae bacterium]|nr:MATE family efflux transporter [Ignavibacteriaceae bacterium]
MNEKKSPAILGTENIGNLLWQYSIPAIISTTVASLYNVIDRIFIGQGVGSLAISGLAITFPLMNLSAAFGSLIGVGSSAMVSIKLGEKDTDGATKILGNAVLLNVLIGIFFTVIMFTFLDQVLYLFGASKDTLPYAKDFMSIILLGSVVTHLYLGLNNIMRASGYPKEAMIVTVFTIGINIILAPIFIFKFEWGISGAALATVLAQIGGLIWVLLHFLRKSHYVHFTRNCFKLELKIIREIFSIGISTFIMFTTSSLVVILMNVTLAEYGGDYAIGAFGIIVSIQSLFAMIVLGFSQGMQPIAGFNFGAKQFNRVREVLKKTILAGTVVTSFGFILCELFPKLIASAFTKDVQLITDTSLGMYITFALFPIVGFQMVTTNFFLSIGHARVSIILSLTRQVIFLTPALIVLPGIFSLYGVWMAIPTADLLSALVTFIILKKQLKKIRD